MVAADEEERVLVEYLQGIQVEEHFNRKRASVHVITQKQVCRVADRPADFKQLDQVVVLTVNVSAYFVIGKKKKSKVKK